MSDAPTLARRRPARLREDEVWRLPERRAGSDARLVGGSARPSTAPRPPLSPAAKARLARIARRTPEAMVKVTGRARAGAGPGTAGHLKAHLDYLTRNGSLRLETSDGEAITDRAALRALHDDWLLANAAEARARTQVPDAAQSVGLILSMPPGTPPDRVEMAARAWARETFADGTGANGGHDWLMVRHDDRGHPHVHVTVRAVGRDGRRLAPGPDDLRAWRERFARELRRLGVEAEATPRQARGVVPKRDRLAVRSIEGRGIDPRARAAAAAAARRPSGEGDAKQPAGVRVDTEGTSSGRRTAATEPPQPRDWRRDVADRQEAIRRAYLAHAEGLAASADASDRALARDISRFATGMPLPLAGRDAIAPELRGVLDRHPGHSAPEPGARPADRTPPEESRAVPRHPDPPTPSRRR